MARRTTKKVRRKIGPRHAILTFDGEWWTAEAPFLLQRSPEMYRGLLAKNGPSPGRDEVGAVMS